MRAVVDLGHGVLELNLMWLPTWIAINQPLCAEIRSALSQKIIGRSTSANSLDEIHDMVVDYLVDKFSTIRGLGDYLNALHRVVLDDPHDTDKPTDSSH